MNEDGAPAPRSLIDLIDQLVESPEPAPVAMTPQTWGWAVLAALLALALAWIAWRAWRHWRANAYRRAALAALPDGPAILASGPLTSPGLAAALTGLVGGGLYFYDAISPIIEADSVATLARTTAPWTPWLRFTVTPILPIEESSSIALEAIAFRDSVE